MTILQNFWETVWEQKIWVKSIKFFERNIKKHRRKRLNIKLYTCFHRKRRCLIRQGTSSTRIVSWQVWWSRVNAFTEPAEAQTLQVPITDKPSIWHLIYSTRRLGMKGFSQQIHRGLYCHFKGNKMHVGCANQFRGEENKNICVELSKTEKYEMHVGNG